MNILAINCFSYDTAVALRGGTPIAFVEEERFNREKHTKSFPDAAIAFCLETAGITVNEIDVTTPLLGTGSPFGAHRQRGVFTANSRGAGR